MLAKPQSRQASLRQAGRKASGRQLAVIAKGSNSSFQYVLGNPV